MKKKKKTIRKVKKTIFDEKEFFYKNIEYLPTHKRKEFFDERKKFRLQNWFRLQIL